MKLSHGLGLAGIGLCAASVALAVGCSSSGGGTPAGGSGDTCESNPGKCVVQPVAPSGPATTVTAAHNYAMRKLYLGDTDRMGVSNMDAWKDLGYNLDDKITTKDSTDVCTLAQGTQKVAQTDGTGGIDNSFGENILPIVLELGGSDLTTKLNTDINSNGAFTIMAYVKGFDDTNPMQTATGLSGVLLAGGPYSYLDAGAPPWNTMTHWPIRPDLINGCTSTGGCPAGTDPVKNASIQFPSAYVANGTFVNGTPSTFDLSLSFSGQVLDIKIHSAVITFQAKSPGSVTNGTIAGVINTNELNTDIMNIAGHISTSLCSGSALMSIQQTISQASDIIINSDGSVTNTAGQACNAISIGLGFDATEIAAPASSDIMPPSPAAPDPCMMGGGSDAGMGGD